MVEGGIKTSKVVMPDRLSQNTSARRVQKRDRIRSIEKIRKTLKMRQLSQTPTDGWIARD